MELNPKDLQKLIQWLRLCSYYYTDFFRVKFFITMILSRKEDCAKDLKKGLYDYSEDLDGEDVYGEKFIFLKS